MMTQFNESISQNTNQIIKEQKETMGFLTKREVIY